MSADELIKTIEAAGGRLSVSGEKIRYSLPEDALHLIDHLREQKPAVIEILKRRTASLPWPGYNGDQPFVCLKCGLHFDTGAGIAKHQVYGCATPTAPQPEVVSLPSCPVCGSFALYRERDGTKTCETCGAAV